MSTHVLFLQNNLKKFGLNPADWKIRQLREKKYKIANIHDGQFYFLGEAKSSGGIPSWNHIILASF